MLGVGDFYYELGVQIIEVCLALKHRNGGALFDWKLKDNKEERWKFHNYVKLYSYYYNYPAIMFWFYV